MSSLEEFVERGRRLEQALNGIPGVTARVGVSGGRTAAQVVADEEQLAEERRLIRRAREVLANHKNGQRAALLELYVEELAAALELRITVMSSEQGT